MGAPVTKTDTVKALVSEGQYKKALNIAKTFRLGIDKDDIDAMALAYECMVRPEFYYQLRYDTEAVVKHGVSVLKRLYGSGECI